MAYCNIFVWVAMVLTNQNKQIKSRKIIFICTGNTCRSPIADGIFKAMLRERGVCGLSSESAGLCAVPGMPAEKNAIAAAAERGVDISRHKASPAEQSLLDGADIVVCMTNAHAEELKKRVSPKKVVVLGGGIPDPYGGGIEIYRECVSSVEKGLAALMDSAVFDGGEFKSFTQIDSEDVDITGGFWRERQELNRDVTLGAVRGQFEDTGRFDAFGLARAKDKPFKPHMFWDSDVAKWLESAALILSKNKDKKLEKFIDDIVCLIEKNQCGDGYFNTFFTAENADGRFKDRMSHELYCAGHLIEAAVAYFRATGKQKFLNCMRRYADLIEKVFKIDGLAEFTTPGHEEIELSLVKLYRCTGETRYLELSKFFIDARGNPSSKEVIKGENRAELQDHLPVREQATAEGHSVRACCLYSGMADIARECRDTELSNACEKLFDNITKKRMYITGGIGSTRDGERFTGDYDLPNDTAYAETCAAISLAMFGVRMSLISADSSYADVVERVLYNGMLSGVSLDGKSFFYENPLEINLSDRSIPAKENARCAITRRAEVFDCSCCPPNITRFIASLGGYIYSFGGDTVFVHQFIDSVTDFDFNGSGAAVRQSTRYPDDGAVAFEAKGMRGKRLAVRIPSWCSNYSFDKQPSDVTKGYAYFDIDSDKFELSYEMEMTPKWYEASAKVWADAGKVALARGPVVYCVEGVDNGRELWTLYADIFSPVKEIRDEKLNLLCLDAAGYKKAECCCRPSPLYRPVSGNFLPARLRFIPYYAFANRGETDMAVWVGKLC